MLSQEQQKLRCGWKGQGRLVSKMTEAMSAKFRVWTLPHRHWERPSSFPGYPKIRIGRHRSGLALLLLLILSTFFSRLWCMEGGERKVLGHWREGWGLRAVQHSTGSGAMPSPDHGVLWPNRLTVLA